MTTYTTGINGNDLQLDEIESVMLKKFGHTITKGALTWYKFLPKHYIDSSAMLPDVFVEAHIGAQKVETQMKCIFKIKQRDGELLQALWRDPNEK